MKFEIDVKKKDLKEFAKRISDAGDFPLITDPVDQLREFFFWEYRGTPDIRDQVRIRRIG